MSVIMKDNGEIFLQESKYPISTPFVPDVPSPRIGDIYGGGIVISTNPKIIVSTENIVKIPWGCDGSYLGATGITVGTGKLNTSIICSLCPTEVIAARVCVNYSGGGYTDWYLPSVGEMGLIYNMRNTIGGFINYWPYLTSTENTANYVACYVFPNVGGGATDKYNFYHFRPIRNY